MWVWSKSIDYWPSYYRNQELYTNLVIKEQCWISRSSYGQGHDATCWWKGLNLGNNVCKYEVNWLTNEKVIRGKQNFNANC